MEQNVDAEGRVIHPGDRIYTYDNSNKDKPTRMYGTIYCDEESEWYIEFDNGNECTVLDFQLIYKA